MLRILILGGTRFLGRSVVKSLAAAGHDLTLISRRQTDVPSGVRNVCEERTVGLERLKGYHFNLVIDFICYDEENIDDIGNNVVAENYVLVSSTWVPRLWSGKCAVELPTLGVQPVGALSDVTKNYLSGKLRAELALTKLRKLGCNAVSLRLPIILGEGDHTGRLDFYLRRFVDTGPLILVGGGNNHAQIVSMEDIAQAIILWCTKVDISRFLVWEALPGEGESVRKIIETMVTSVGAAVNFVDVSIEELSQKLPAFLHREPFWRETTLPLTAANIFSAVNMKPNQFGKHITMPANIDNATDDLRSLELKFLAGRDDD